MVRMYGRLVDSNDEKPESIERPFDRLMAHMFRHCPVRISPTVVCIITTAMASAVDSIFI